MDETVSSRLARRLEREWQSGGILSVALVPVSILYGALVGVRRSLYKVGLLKVVPSSLPVVVVGNLTVGGTGKTPLTAWLVDEFRARGWSPGIVSRGYGSVDRSVPHLLTACDKACDVGDEPFMLNARTGAPVCVCSDRPLAVAELARATDCDLVLSDDGLQHLAMSRDAEIVVVDAEAGFGNGRLLPSGPLREGLGRLHSVDALALRHRADVPPGDVLALASEHGIARGRLPPHFGFALGRPRIKPLTGGQWQDLSSVSACAVRAAAGIAHPIRFFELLRSAGFTVTEQVFPDHHAFVAEDLDTGDDLPVYVTSKDAVKLRDLPAALAERISEVSVEVVADTSSTAWLDALSRRLGMRAEAG